MSRSPEKRILHDAKRLIGLQIAGVRYMTSKECSDLFIQNRAIVLTLSDGTLLCPMADDEGNDAAVLIARLPNGEETHLSCLPR